MWRTVRPLAAILVLVGACGADSDLVGNSAPDGAPGGDAVDSGIESFPRPADLEVGGRTLGDAGLDTRTFQASGPVASSLAELRSWYAEVLPRGVSQGDWHWCDESDGASDVDEREIRRYEHPDLGVLEVEIRELDEPLVQVLRYSDGDCTVDPHDVRCVDAECDELFVDE